MKLNAGIITHKLDETRNFYTEVFGFGLTFDSEWFILMHTPDQSSSIGFLVPNHPSQAAIFQSEFQGKGVFITVEVEDVDAEYERIKSLQIPIIVDLRDEPWGDRHFAITDPNGIGVDVVTHNG